MKGGEGGNNQQVTEKAVRKLKCTVLSNTNPGLGEKPHARDCRAEATI